MIYDDNDYDDNGDGDDDDDFVANKMKTHYNGL